MCSYTVRRISTVEIYREESRYISFPDVVRASNGMLLCAFRDADIHYPPCVPETELILMDSSDNGQSWGNKRVFPYQPKDHDLWCWHCVRLSLLSDGRIALACDLVNPEEHLSTTHISLSADNGKTWSEPIDTGASGIMPDRLLELSPGQWLFSTHKSEKAVLAQRAFATTDFGKSWQERGVVAADGHRHYCEASTIRLESGELVCYLRENSFLHQPTFVCFSKDNGQTWSEPKRHPTHGHRPCAGLLDKDTVLLTYRNVAGNPGLFAWIGSPHEIASHAAGKDLSNGSAVLSEQGLQICSSDGGGGVEYTLCPMEDWDCEFSFTAKVRCTSGQENTCSMRAAGILQILPDKVEYFHRPNAKEPEERVSLGSIQINGTQFHEYSIRYCKRKVEVFVDGSLKISGEVGETPCRFERKIAFGNSSCNPPNQVKFENHAGESVWRSASLKLRQSTGEEIAWSWGSSSGCYPNQYERNRCQLIDRETSNDWAESGYSGWIRLDEKRIYCVDYRRRDAKNPYIVGHTLEIS